MGFLGTEVELEQGGGAVLEPSGKCHSWPAVTTPCSRELSLEDSGVGASGEEPGPSSSQGVSSHIPPTPGQG